MRPDQQSVDNNVLVKENQINKTFSIIGEWTINKTVSIKDGITNETACNLCPSIRFNVGSLATIVYSTGVIDSLNYTLVGDRLVLKHINPKTKFPYFFDHKYKMRHTQMKDYMEIELSIETNYSYILRR